MDKVVFLDRDGTINVEKNYLYRPEDFEFIPGSESAIKLLNDNGFKVVVVTNQAGVARGYYTEEDVKKLHGYIDGLLKKCGAHIDMYIYCPHHPENGIGKYRCRCSCRKPGTGMFEKAAGVYDIDMGHSWMVGDNAGDMQSGKKFGLKTILVGTGYGEKVMSENKVPFDYYKKDLYEAAEYIVKVSG